MSVNVNGQPITSVVDGNTGPRPRRVLHIGKRYAPSADNVVVDKRGNKLARRMFRRQGLQQTSSIEMAVQAARKLRRESEAMATNSHEAKRYVELEQRARKAAR